MSSRVVKPKSQRRKRELQKREPKTHENVKTAMLIKGGNTSQLINNLLKEMHMLKKPHAVLYKKKNTTRPFEDQTSVEFFSNRADASLFAFGSTSKKRPNNLVIGRLFDYHVLDMVEFGVEKFVSIMDFKGPKCAIGLKPALIFNGEAFDGDSELQRIKNLFIDFYRGPVVNNVRLAGLEHVISFTAIDGKIYIRNYRVQLKKEAGVKGPPYAELTDMGPSVDLVVRRTRLASDDLFKKALKRPKTAKPKKQKNVSIDVFGSKLGRIHMTRQDLTKLPDRRMKRVKNMTKDTEDEGGGNADKEGGSADKEPPQKRAKAKQSEDKEED